MKTHLSAACLALLAAAFASPSFASVGASSVLCGNSFPTIMNGGYIDCQGPVTGNIAPGQTSVATFAGYGTFNLVGKTDDAGAGPFSANPGSVIGSTLSFDTVQKGLFVLGIKGGPTYSLYLFDGGSTGISTLDFDTWGITKGNGSGGPGLSHAALFTSAVPEPETWALMLGGLFAVGAFVRRQARG